MPTECGRKLFMLVIHKHAVEVYLRFGQTGEDDFAFVLGQCCKSPSLVSSPANFGP